MYYDSLKKIILLLLLLQHLYIAKRQMLLPIVDFLGSDCLRVLRGINFTSAIRFISTSLRLLVIFAPLACGYADTVPLAL